MNLTLLPLQTDELIRVQCEGPLSQRDTEDPLLHLLGPHCYSHKVLLSLEGCPMADTSGISWLLGSDKRFRKAGGRMVIFGVPPVVTDLLQFMRLEGLLAMAANEHAATELAQTPEEGNGPAAAAGPSLRFSPMKP